MEVRKDEKGVGRGAGKKRMGSQKGVEAGQGQDNEEWERGRRECGQGRYRGSGKREK